MAGWPTRGDREPDGRAAAAWWRVRGAGRGLAGALAAAAWLCVGCASGREAGARRGW